MGNQDIAQIFERMADLMEILGENPFRVNSYRKAARAVSDWPGDLAESEASGELEQIPGIGASTAAKIRQFLSTGKIDAYEELAARTPPGLGQLTQVPGLGPKTVAKLWREAGIESVEDLKKALQEQPDRLTGVKGLGARKLQQILESLTFLATSSQRRRLDEAWEVAERMLSAVADAPGVEHAAVAGSLRRGRETIGDVDLLCLAPLGRGREIIEQFARAPGVQRVLARGETKGSVFVREGMQVDLRVVPAESFGAAMLYFTGSKDHNVRLRERAAARGWKLNEYGLTDADGKLLAGATEEEIFQALQLAYIPPELREDRGELTAAEEGTLPKLIETDDIRGDLHVHTVASDGRNTIEEMIDAARARGYEYLAICDHSHSQIQANGLKADRLLEHVDAIRRAGRQKRFKVAAGTEVDIFKDGSLDYPPEILRKLDFVVASPHSALKQGREEATARLIAAMRSGLVDCIGHPSGRLVGRRQGMELDMEAIAREAARHDVALEINADPSRLDLRDTHARTAIAAGAKLLINTDAHAVDDYALMRFGVVTARRAWATAGDVINTWPVKKFVLWQARRRR